MERDLKNLIDQTGEIFSKLGEMEVPVPSLHWERRLKGLEDVKLWRQYRLAVFEMRCAQVESLGFQRVYNSCQ